MKKLSLLGSLILWLGYAHAQTTDEQNLQKYWKYRDRLKTYFMKIGREPGESLPMSCRIPNWSARSSAEHDVTTTLEWRDATISLGYYLIVLATEYKLLADEGEDTEATIIELYYALNALDRLDLSAENYLEQIYNSPQSQHLNGLFLRDDVKQDFATQWETEHLPPNYPIEDGNEILVVDADATGFDYGPLYEYNRGNVESLDQLTTILLGLKFVIHLIPDMVFEIPELTAEAGEPVYHNLRLMAGQAIVRCLTYLNNLDQLPSDFKEWKILMPDGQLVPRGFDCMLPSVAFLNLAAEIDQQLHDDLKSPGKVYIEFRERDLCETFDNINPSDDVVAAVGEFLAGIFMSPFVTRMTEELASMADMNEGLIWRCAHCGTMALCPDEAPNDEPVLGPIPFKLRLSSIQALWNAIENNQMPIYVDSQESACIDISEFVDDISNGFLSNGLILSLADELCVNLSNKKLDEDNVHLILEQAVIGNMWGPSYTRYIADNSQMYHIPMMWDVFTNVSNPAPVSTSGDRYFYQDILKSAPCEGPWANPNGPVTPENCAPGGWGGPNRLSQPDNGWLGPKNEDNQPDPNYRGYYPGLDYMVYHNLYHLLWRNEQDMPDYSKDSYCECHIEITDESLLTEALEIERYHPDYLRLEIPVESYLSHDLTLNSGAIMDVKNDLVICRRNPDVHTTLHVTNGSMIRLYNGNTITVRSGNRLIIDEGAELMCGIDYEESCCGKIARIIVEENAELQILNATLTNYDGVVIELKPGSRFYAENGQIVVSAISDGQFFVCDECEFLMNNSVYNKLDGSALTISSFYNANLKFDNSSVWARNSHFIISESSVLNVNSCTMSFLNGAITAEYNTVVNLNLSDIYLNNSNLRYRYGSTVSQDKSNLFLYNSASIRGGLDNDSGEDANSYYYKDGEIHLNGEQTNMTFGKVKFYIAGYKTFAPVHNNYPSGFLEFKGSLDKELYIAQGATFYLEGDGEDDLMLKVNNGTNLWNAFFQRGEIKLKNCKVDLTNKGAIWADIPVNAEKVKFVDYIAAADLETGNVQVWNNDGTFIDCKFEGVRIKSTDAKIKMSLCDLEMSGAALLANRGNYFVEMCNFRQCGIESYSLDMGSQILNCKFNAGSFPANAFSSQAILDESSVELRVVNCVMAHLYKGISKYGGKLSLSCSSFIDVVGDALHIESAYLNMSTGSAAGNNSFQGVGNCIRLKNADGIDLHMGYNDLSGYTYKCIYGSLNKVCIGSCENTLSAQRNYWGAATATWPNVPVYTGPYQPGMSYVIIDVYGADAPQNCYLICNSGCPPCRIQFSDTEPQLGACGRYKPIVRNPKSSDVQESGTGKVFAQNLPGQLRDLVIDPGNPLINTEHFENIALDSALIYAAMNMEMYDSLAADHFAVELFHEILTHPLDRTNEDIRWRMEWGRYNMKSALENMFHDGELVPANNEEFFETPVQLYVDVLNAMTDTVLTDSTYREQFYLEIDKGQLFRTLNNPDFARYIYSHLDDCDLDSLEQVRLNYWLEEVDREISVRQQYMLDGIAPDSIDFSVDTASYQEPQLLDVSEFYFGMWIDSPQSVTFVPCGGNYAYKYKANGTQNFELYPNPASREFKITCSNTGNYLLKMTDAFGRKVLERQLQLQEEIPFLLVPDNKPAPGQYILSLTDSHGTMVKKVTIE